MEKVRPTFPAYMAGRRDEEMIHSSQLLLHIRGMRGRKEGRKEIWLANQAC